VNLAGSILGLYGGRLLLGDDPPTSLANGEAVEGPTGAGDVLGGCDPWDGVPVTPGLHPGMSNERTAAITSLPFMWTSFTIVMACEAADSGTLVLRNW
jgi:hypothetical protein